jgi:maltose O-acetyltransferase
VLIYTLLRKIIYGFVKKKKEAFLNDLVKKGLKLGKNVDIVDNFSFDPSHCFLISIGDNCTICPNVRLIAHDASTKKILGYTKIGRIDIQENCFIGDSAIIMPGVTIGQNSIVGAGSVITKDVPPHTVAAGNPARILFPVEQYISKIENISKLKKIFNKEYHIDNLNEAKRQEIIESIEKTIGFII